MISYVKSFCRGLQYNDCHLCCLTSVLLEMLVLSGKSVWEVSVSAVTGAVLVFYCQCCQPL